MTNLLQETRSYIEKCEKTTDDVKWVGNGEYVISWEEFTKIADVEYDSGYGAQEIASDLLIVGDNWWLEREEYDGSEGWSFKTMPLKNKETKSFSKVKGGMWNNLDDLTKEG